MSTTCQMPNVKNVKHVKNVKNVKNVKHVKHVTNVKCKKMSKMSNVKNPKSQNPKSKIPNNKCLRNLKVITNWGRAGFIYMILYTKCGVFVRGCSGFRSYFLSKDCKYYCIHL